MKFTENISKQIIKYNKFEENAQNMWFWRKYNISEEEQISVSQFFYKS